MLLSKGAQVEAEDIMARRPLHYAAANGNVRVIEVLLAAGADINAFTSGGETPIMKAVFFMRNEAVRSLLDSGANVFC